MRAKTHGHGARQATLITLVVALIAVSGLFVTGTTAARTTHARASGYTATFYEAGLPAGTPWFITFNGTTVNSTSSSVSFGSMAGGQYYYWSVGSPVNGPAWGEEYVPTASDGDMLVPNQLSQVILFQLEYQVQAVSSIPNAAVLTPGSATYYPAGSNVSITAVPYFGYTVQSFLASTSASHWKFFQGGSAVLSLGAPTNVTVNLRATSYTLSFNETGLPAGYTWNVTLGSTTLGSTTSYISTRDPAGYYPFTVSPVFAFSGNEEFVPTVSLDYLDPPYVTNAQVVFLDEFRVNFTVNPSSSGYVLPSGSGYFPWTPLANAPVVVASESTSTTVFSHWSGGPKLGLSFANSTSGSTLATVYNFPVTIQANFVAGTPCSTRCKVIFDEFGIPSTHNATQVAWGVDFNGSFLGSLSTSITLSGVNASATSGYWSVPSPIYSGTPGIYYVATTSSGYLSVPYETVQVVQYVKEAYVTFSSNPQYLGPSVSDPSGYYPVGSELPIAALSTDLYGFSGWTSSNSSALSLGASTVASTTLTVQGPGWVNATFSARMRTVTFTEMGLPKGLVWGVTFGPSTYYASAVPLGSAATSSLTLPSLPAGTYYWAPVTPLTATKPNEQYAAEQTYGDLYDVADTGQVLVFATQVKVNFVVTGTSGGSIAPSASAFFDVGSSFPLEAINGSSATFGSWSASNSGATFASPSLPSTVVEIAAATTIRASFT